MKSFRTTAAALAASLLLSLPAAAVPVEFLWTTTASQFTGNTPGSVGETITTILTFDNGGTSTASQTFGAGDFVSYRIEGESGWYAESSNLVDSSGSFSTDASSMVTSVMRVTDGGYFANLDVTTSWSGAQQGGWWNNGFNQVFCTTPGSGFDCVWADDVSGNQNPANWTARMGDIAPVPLPAGGLLLVAGLGGLALFRRRKAAA